MSDLSEKLAAIEARVADCMTYNFGLYNADKLAHDDAPFLLALVREQAAKLAKVEALCVERDKTDCCGNGAISTKHLRAAIRDKE